MQVIRYLNGKRLHGAMPPLLLDRDGVGALLGAARYRQQLPLPDTAPLLYWRRRDAVLERTRHETHSIISARITEAQADEGYSLAAQAEKLEAYCRMKGIMQ